MAGRATIGISPSHTIGAPAASLGRMHGPNKASVGALLDLSEPQTATPKDTANMTRQEAFRILDQFPTRKVCKAVESDSELSDAVFEIRSRGQKSWTKREWDAMLAELDACRLPIADWVELERLVM